MVLPKACVVAERVIRCDFRFIIGVTRRKLQKSGTVKEQKKTNNTYNQPKHPSIGKTHRPSTRHHRKSSLRFKSHNTNQHSNHARLQRSNPYPSSHRPSRIIARVLSQRSSVHVAGAQSRTTTQTPPVLAGTRGSPLPEGPSSGGTDGQP